TLSARKAPGDREFKSPPAHHFFSNYFPCPFLRCLKSSNSKTHNEQDWHGELIFLPKLIMIVVMVVGRV
ncbi:MAG: hypothetical protein KGD60_16215, partial [Candidatus Thorarchaeota archaeon]|nr:hypothetical protein [Candidatus Thorarchaeota archaeon]